MSDEQEGFVSITQYLFISSHFRITHPFSIAGLKVRGKQIESLDRINYGRFSKYL